MTTFQRILRLGALLALIVAMLASSPATAQDGTPTDPATDVVVADVIDPTNEPEPAVEPTVVLEPTMAPEPTAEIVVTQEPTSEPGAAPADETDTPETTDEASGAPATVSPPDAELTYRQAPAPDCRIDPDGAASVRSGAAIDYLCTDSVELSGTGVVPGQLSIEWTVSFTIGSDWEIQLLPPANPGEDRTWTSPQRDTASFTFQHPQPAGAEDTPTEIAATSGIDYRIRLIRPACALNGPDVTITRDITVLAQETTPVDLGEEAAPVRIEPNLAPLPDPTVSFDGPLSLGEVTVTAEGISNPAQAGSLTVVVSDLNLACGEWTLHLSGGDLTDSNGNPLTGSSLVIVSINGEPLATPCDLASGCDPVTLAAGPGAPTLTSLQFGIELRMPDQPNTGSFQTALSAALIPIARD